MALQSLPWAIQGSTHPAEVGRNLTASVFGAPVAAFANAVGATTAGGSHGVVGSGDLLVSQNGTPNMSVNIAAGRALVRAGNASSILAGVYSVLNDAVVNVAIAASDPTNPRIDLVCAQVRDTNYGEAASDVRFFVVTGTPGAVPVVPSLATTPNALVLAQVAVAATSTTVLNAAITDKRTFAYSLGGMARCQSTNRPSGVSLYAGLRIFEIDTNRELTYDGTGWVIMSEPEQSFAQTVSSSVGTITTVGATTFKYTRRDGWLNFVASITITTNGTGASAINSTLPVAAQAGITAIGSGRETSATGSGLVAFSNGSNWSINTYNNAYPAGSGFIMSIVGSYRMTTRYS